MIRKSLKQGFNLAIQNWPLILIQIFLNGVLTLVIEIPAQFGKIYFLEELERIYEKPSINILQTLREFLAFLGENLNALFLLGFYLFSMLLIWNILLLFIQGGIRGVFKEALGVRVGLNLIPTEKDRQEVFPFYEEVIQDRSDLVLPEKEDASNSYAFSIRAFIRYARRFFSRMLALQAWLSLVFMMLVGILAVSVSLAFYLLDQSEKIAQQVGIAIVGSGLMLFFILGLLAILAQPYASIAIVLEDIKSFRGLIRGFRFVVNHIGGVLRLFFISLGLFGVTILALDFGEVTASHLEEALSEKNLLFKTVFPVLSYLTWGFFQSSVQLFILGSQMSYYVMNSERRQAP
jgi:hypothetical protein